MFYYTILYYSLFYLTIHISRRFRRSATSAARTVFSCGVFSSGTCPCLSASCICLTTASPELIDGRAFFGCDSRWTRLASWRFPSGPGDAEAMLLSTERLPITLLLPPAAREEPHRDF